MAQGAATSMEDGAFLGRVISEVVRGVITMPEAITIYEKTRMPRAWTKQQASFTAGLERHPLFPRNSLQSTANYDQGKSIWLDLIKPRCAIIPQDQRLIWRARTSPAPQHQRQHTVRGICGATQTAYLASTPMTLKVTLITRFVSISRVEVMSIQTPK
jgi:2-polyprenyl-6-methoxyphenol hydroxylase-like FAD-dependent oxidoreductase